MKQTGAIVTTKPFSYIQQCDYPGKMSLHHGTWLKNNELYVQQQWEKSGFHVGIRKGSEHRKLASNP